VESPIVEKLVESPIVEKLVESPIVEKLVESPIVEKLVESPIVEKLVESPVVDDVTPIIEPVELPVEKIDEERYTVLDNSLDSILEEDIDDIEKYSAQDLAVELESTVVVPRKRGRPKKVVSN